MMLAGEPRTMAKTTSALTRLRQICLSLPDTRETLTWGEPHFRAGDKILCDCGDEDGRPEIGFKLEREDAAAIVPDPRLRRAPYVGHKGWVSMDASRVEDWNEVAKLAARAATAPESGRRRTTSRHATARKR
jgi:predicted DNA-binding protein (MmcQ/YjbR family)